MFANDLKASDVMNARTMLIVRQRVASRPRTHLRPFTSMILSGFVIFSDFQFFFVKF